MAQYFNIFSPVYGGLGSKTVTDTSTVPPTLVKLHYDLVASPKSELFEGLLCYLVSMRLAEALEAAKLSGFQLAEAKVRPDPQWRKLGRKMQVEHYAWLKITGRREVDDFGLDRFSRIVVSEAALAVLRQFNLEECQIINSNEAPTPEERIEKFFLRRKPDWGGIRLKGALFIAQLAYRKCGQYLVWVRASSVSPVLFLRLCAFASLR